MNSSKNHKDIASVSLPFYVSQFKSLLNAIILASALHKTQVQLNAANTQVIANPSAVSKAPKVTKQIINTLLAPAKSLAELLGHLSEVVPQTEPVADLFKVRDAHVCYYLYPQFTPAIGTIEARAR